MEQHSTANDGFGIYMTYNEAKLTIHNLCNMCTDRPKHILKHVSYVYISTLM